MRIGFKLRNLKIQIEDKVRRTVFLLRYIFWFIFIPKAKKPKNINNVLIVDLTKTWGDVFYSMLFVYKAMEEYPNINFWFLAQNKFIEEAEKGYNLKFIKLKDLQYVPFDMALILCMSGDTRISQIPVKYKVGMEVGGLLDIFKNIRFSRMIFPRYIHKIEQRFEIFKLANLEFSDKSLICPISDYYVAEADKIAEELNLKEDDKIIFINPEASTSNKAREEGKFPSHDWDKFPELTNFLLKDPEVKIIITGTNKELDIIGIKNPRVLSIAGRTSYFGLGELLRKFKDNGCLISIDTGAIPLGSSVGIKTIDLMGPYDPKLISAWQGTTLSANSSCSKCRKYYCAEKDNICMKKINVEEVIKYVPSEVCSNPESKAG